MVIKLVVIVSLAALARSHIEAPVAFGHSVGYGPPPPAVAGVHIFPALPTAFVPYAAAQAEETAKRIPDPAVTAAHSVHKTFLEKHEIKPPYHYSYGYEVYDWKTGVTRSHYESRYGDVGVGTYILRASDGLRTVVDYTVDTPNGFYAVVRKDFHGRAVKFDYDRLGAPLAYASHPAAEEYASRTTLLADPAAIDDPLIEYIYRYHKFVIEYLDVAAPFNLSYGYEVIYSQTRLRKSHYETYHGNTGEGSYVLVEADGTKSRIDYSISPKGVAFTSPETA